MIDAHDQFTQIPQTYRYGSEGSSLSCFEAIDACSLSSARPTLIQEVHDNPESYCKHASFATCTTPPWSVKKRKGNFCAKFKSFASEWRGWLFVRSIACKTLTGRENALILRPW
jgi:hypothetical protein